MTKKQIGAKIRKLRLLKGYSQRRFAAAAGLNHGPVSLLELGKSNIGIQGLIDILDLLDAELYIRPKAEPIILKDEYSNL